MCRCPIKMERMGNKTNDEMRQLDTTNPSKKQTTPSKKQTTHSKKQATLSQKQATPSNKKVTPSKKKIESFKKIISATKKRKTTPLSKSNYVINKYFPSNTVLDDNDCEEMGGHNNKQLQCSSTTLTENTSKLCQLADPKKIIHKLCTSLNKSNLFEPEEEFVEEEDDDDGRDNYTKAFLGSFPIYKSKIKCSSHLRPLDTYIYIPPFRVKKHEMRKAGFWKNWEARLARNVDFSTEDIQEELKNKIEAVIEHFKNCDSSEYTSSEDCPAEASKKINFNAPYLPTLHELKVSNH